MQWKTVKWHQLISCWARLPYKLFKYDIKKIFAAGNVCDTDFMASTLNSMLLFVNYPLGETIIFRIFRYSVRKSHVGPYQTHGEGKRARQGAMAWSRRADEWGKCLWQFLETETGVELQKHSSHTPAKPFIGTKKLCYGVTSKGCCLKSEYIAAYEITSDCDKTWCNVSDLSKKALPLTLLQVLESLKSTVHWLIELQTCYI